MLSSIQTSSGVAPCRRKLAGTPCFFLSELNVVSLVFSLSQLNFEQSLYRDVYRTIVVFLTGLIPLTLFIQWIHESWASRRKIDFCGAKNLKKLLRPLPNAKSQLLSAKKKKLGWQVEAPKQILFYSLFTFRSSWNLFEVFRDTAKSSKDLLLFLTKKIKKNIFFIFFFKWKKYFF